MPDDAFEYLRLLDLRKLWNNIKKSWFKVAILETINVDAWWGMMSIDDNWRCFF